MKTFILQVFTPEGHYFEIDIRAYTFIDAHQVAKFMFPTGSIVGIVEKQ